MNKWIFVESYYNWSQDKINNFKFIGINQKKLIQKKISDGDIFFTYISKVKKFSDCRRILSSNSIDTPLNYKYDKHFPKCISTEIIKELRDDEWLDLTRIFGSLEIFSTVSSPQLKLLNAPTLINDYDAGKLCEFMNIKEMLFAEKNN